MSASLRSRASFASLECVSRLSAAGIIGPGVSVLAAAFDCADALSFDQFVHSMKSSSTPDSLVDFRTPAPSTCTPTFQKKEPMRSPRKKSSTFWRSPTHPAHQSRDLLRAKSMSWADPVLLLIWDRTRYVHTQRLCDSPHSDGRTRWRACVTRWRACVTRFAESVGLQKVARICGRFPYRSTRSLNFQNSENVYFDRELVL